MNADDRLDQLERRLRDLEELVLGLRAALRVGEVDTAPRTITRAGAARAARSPPAAVPTVPPAPPKPAAAPTRPSGSGALAVGTEQWFGQRGLLAAGVFLLILAAGYFLKLAFDRGWISPFLRCLGGGVFGLGVAAVGWRVHRRGLRAYGAALMGCGAAIAYLAVWAAVRLYDLLPDAVGLGAMAVLSVATFATASMVNVEGLAAAATLGAFLAPLVIGQTGNPNVLLLYSLVLAAGLGGVAHKRWRLTTFLIGICFFTLGLTASFSSRTVPANVLMYAVLGASSGLAIGLRERWTETRFLAFWGGWVLLRAGVAAHPREQGLLIAAGGMLLTVPIWWHAWRSADIWPDRPRDAADSAETLYFYATPLWLVWAVAQAAPAWFARHDWAAPLAVSLPYLAAGYARLRVPFAVVGTAAALVAALAAWPGVHAVWALVALAFLWAGLDHPLQRGDGRWYALVAAGAALLHLITVDLSSRGARAPAFMDAWALSLWLLTVSVVVLALGLWRRVQPVGAAAPPRPVWQGRSLGDLFTPEHVLALLWIVAGLLLFVGVTNELTRFFWQTVMSRSTARLAGGLAVSAWWAVFAAGLVILGFQRRLKAVRIAGLVVSGLAVAKVLVFDLSELDALYRIASVFTLGLVSLGVAYLYHRQARA
jgi:uncharacterized membrane protein